MMALALTRVDRSWRTVLLIMVLLPFRTSFLLRVCAWVGLRANEIEFNQDLTGTWNSGIPAEWAVAAILMMISNLDVVLVDVCRYRTFVILPLYDNLEKRAMTPDKAAKDLGSRPFRVAKGLERPLSAQGMILGGPSAVHPGGGKTDHPVLVGHASPPTIGWVISDEFALVRDWPMASVLAAALLVVPVIPMMLCIHFRGREPSQARGRARTVLCSL